MVSKIYFTNYATVLDLDTVWSSARLLNKKFNWKMSNIAKSFKVTSWIYMDKLFCQYYIVCDQNDTLIYTTNL